MKSWLKGLLVGSVIGIILYFLGWIAEYSFVRNLISMNDRFWITSPFCAYYLPGDEAVICFVIFGLPLNIIIFGLFGFIIGWIISKLKFVKER